ncbi:protein-tyrosine-phosphatase [Agromyces rhizosphaerae]|uniref:Protein-tyrosine-phosphatase n=1 Tax=Agromyces rhizosphaerae TaxID=88374 RepID=A0A9W6CWB8_9MICO|nr:tyrosine-protein phosphatase [Agromyces rhizosphaerae]GLI27246.1 protein-tyrosine-phosphatase [Agromyces rhizosphaerae]
MRDLLWDGYVNCRDLGDLPTPASSTGYTARHRVARGPRRERLTARGWDQARMWGLRTVVDLRAECEVGPRDGDPSVDETVVSATVLRTPTEDQSDPEFMRRCLPILDSPEYWEHNWELQPELVGAAISAIASSGPGTLIHCSAGRDRTGMVSALLLGNAEVAPEAVVDDYAASVHAMASTPSHAAQPMSGWTGARIAGWVQERAPIVHATAADAPAILARLGVDPDTRESLRHLLLP